MLTVKVTEIFNFYSLFMLLNANDCRTIHTNGFDGTQCLLKSFRKKCANYRSKIVVLSYLTLKYFDALFVAHFKN